VNGDTPAKLENLILGLAQTPDRVARLLTDIPGQNLRVRFSPSEFSALENICHLRDIEAEGYTTRITRILNEDCPRLSDIDGGRLAVERAYNDQQVSEALEAFVIVRQRNVHILRQIKEEQLDRPGLMEGVGEITLRRLLLMMREHDDEHLDDLRLIRERLSLSTAPLQST